MSPDDFAAALPPEKVSEILRQRAAALAAEPVALHLGEPLQLLIFWLGDGLYAFNVEAVRAIYSYAPLTPVPRTPGFIKGLFNARGQILPVLDLRLFLKLPAAPDEVENGHIILLSYQPDEAQTLPLEIGILVSRVMDVVTVFAEEINPAPLTQPLTPYVRGITRAGVMVLNSVELLMDEQLFVDEEII